MATVAEAQAQLAKWENASLALARGEVARVGDQRIDRADAESVVRMMNYWRAEVARLQRVAASGDDLSVTLATFAQSSKFI